MRGRAPITLNDLLSAQHVNHSTIAIEELMHAAGVLDPADTRTRGAIATIEAQIVAMRPHRMRMPDADVLGRAALLSGILCRLQGYDNDSRMRALHVCVLFLQALKRGYVLLTANVTDFDILTQMVPGARVLFYRRTD